MALEGFADGEVLRADADLRVEDLSLCAGDSDWYRVVLAPGDQLSARVVVRDAEGEPTEADGPVRVGVVAAGGEALGPEGNFVGPEIIGRSLALPEGGEVFVRVSGDAVAPRYDLTLVRRAAQAMCDDDRFDDAARNDTRESADLLEVEDDRALVVADLNLCNGNAPGGDADWFTLEVAEEGRLQVDLTFAQVDGDLDLEVFRDDALVGTGDSADDNERVVVEDAEPGSYFIRVASFFAQENAYDLRIEHAPRAACAADPFEGNDDADGAVEADAGFDREAWVCEFPEDEDWFLVEASPDESMTFHIDFLRNDDGWLTVDVYDADTMFAASSDRNVNGQCVVVDATPGGSSWFFAVTARSFQRDDHPDRVDYRVRVLEGDRCAELEPLLEDDWLHLP